jgi:hypothetical protein
VVTISPGINAFVRIVVRVVFALFSTSIRSFSGMLLLFLLMAGPLEDADDLTFGAGAGIAAEGLGAGNAILPFQLISIFSRRPIDLFIFAGAADINTGAVAGALTAAIGNGAGKFDGVLAGAAATGAAGACGFATVGVVATAGATGANTFATSLVGAGIAGATGALAGAAATGNWAFSTLGIAGSGAGAFAGAAAIGAGLGCVGAFTNALADAAGLSYVLDGGAGLMGAGCLILVASGAGDISLLAAANSARWSILRCRLACMARTLAASASEFARMASVLASRALVLACIVFVASCMVSVWFLTDCNLCAMEEPVFAGACATRFCVFTVAGVSLFIVAAGSIEDGDFVEAAGSAFASSLDADILSALFMFAAPGTCFDALDADSFRRNSSDLLVVWLYAFCDAINHNAAMIIACFITYDF